MAEIVLKGFIINLINYEVFDQIVTILDTNGSKYSLLSLGSRKINSKNARHLIIGNFNEIYFFPARFKDKIGRLKKTITINPINWEIHDYISFHLLNEYANYLLYDDKNFFDFYNELIKILNLKKYKDFAIVVFILVYIIKTNGFRISKVNCSFCDSKNVKFLSKNTYSWFCNKCVHLSDNDIFVEKEEVLSTIIDLLVNSKIEKKISKKEIIQLIIFLKEIIFEILGISFKCLKKLT